jgi:hypothetical protein
MLIKELNRLFSLHRRTLSTTYHHRRWFGFSSVGRGNKVYLHSSRTLKNGKGGKEMQQNREMQYSMDQASYSRLFLLCFFFRNIQIMGWVEAAITSNRHVVGKVSGFRKGREKMRRWEGTSFRVWCSFQVTNLRVSHGV